MLIVNCQAHLITIRFRKQEMINIKYKKSSKINEERNMHELASLSKKYHKTIAQVILRWLMQRAVVTIPNSVRRERIAENLNIFDFELNAEDMEAIKTLDTNTSSFFDHRDPER